jgi:Kef-type K+ transport system membrane component KefB
MIASGLLAVPLGAAAVAANAADDQLIVRLFGVLAVMLLAGKLSGELFERIGQPAVLGELIAGALLGPSLLGVIPIAPTDQLTEIIKIFAELGVVVLLFEIGLETDLRQLLRVGPAASSIAIVGVALPFLFGFLYWLSPLTPDAFNVAHGATTAIFVGATLTATSVGITVRVLKDLRVMGSMESKLVLGAAVIDDVLGLVILGVVASLVAGATVTVLGVTRAFAVAVGFLAAAVGLGLLLAPRVFELINRMRVRGVLLVAAFAFTLLVAAAADVAGSAMIIGAFAAGLILSGTNQFDTIEERIKPVSDIFTPVFFLSIGAQLDLRLLNPFDGDNLVVLQIGGVLFLIAIVGKLVAGWAAPWRQFNRLAVGIGMVPRGEVGLIFANIGLNSGVLSSELFGAILIMVIGTTFIAPPLLKWSFARGGVTPEAAAGRRPVTEPLPDDHPPAAGAPPDAGDQGS